MLQEKCSWCGGRATLTFSRFDCITKGCRNYSKSLWDQYVDIRPGDVIRFTKADSTMPDSSWPYEVQVMNWYAKKYGKTPLRLHFSPDYNDYFDMTVSDIFETDGQLRFVFIAEHKSMYCPAECVEKVR